MFNGIVKSIGIVADVKKMKGGIECTITTPLKRAWTDGESVLISGVCSTIIKKRKNALTFFFMEETLVKTHFRTLQKGDQVNIEPSLTYGEPMSGHLVSGHVDGIVVIKKISDEGKMRRFSFTTPRALTRYIVEKGSVALEGISLTVVDAKGAMISCAAIPYTLSHTTLGQKEVNDQLNIEVDMMAKYIEKMLKKS